MSLIKCSVCGKMVSDENEVCPECRAWLLGRKTTAPLSDGNIHKDETLGTFKLIGLFAVLILVVVFSQFLPTRNATDEDGQTTEAEEEVVEEEDEEDVEKDAADELDDGSVEAPEAEEVNGEEEASVADPSLEEVVDPSNDWVMVLGLDGAKEHDVNSNAKNNGTPFPNLAWGFLGMMDLH